MDSKESKVQLGYWKIRGLAQKIRMILEYIKMPYEEIKYGNEDQDKWFNEEKPKLKNKNPAINLPYLVDGDHIIAESDAIIVHICHKGKRTDLLGSNCEQKVLAATAIGVFRDYHKKYLQLIYGSQQDFDNIQTRVKKIETWKPFLTKLNLMLENKQYFCNTTITWVDFVISENIQAILLLDHLILQEFNNLVQHQKRIWNLPEILNYHSSDKWHERPVNYHPGATWY